MHRDNRGAHDNASGDDADKAHRLAAHDKEGEAGGDDSREQRNQNGGPVVVYWDRQAEGLHPGEVHRPDADAHCDGSAAKPCVPQPAGGGGHATSEVNCCVGRRHRDEYGERYQDVVVRATQRHDYTSFAPELNQIARWLAGGSVGGVTHLCARHHQERVHPLD